MNQAEKYTIDYIGRKNNRLLIVGFARDKYGKKVFDCICDCGNRHLVKPRHWETGRVKSCGCLAAEFTLEHTDDLDRLRRIYSGMVQRCCNSNSTPYRYYGGRGITVCDEWLNDRERFVEWALNHGYRSDLTLDRVNNDGDYEPGNCRWATYKEQMNNQRRPKHHAPKRTIKRGDRMYSLKELCEIHGVLQATVSYRMRVKGMTLDEALNAEKCTNGRPRKDRNAEANG